MDELGGSCCAKGILPPRQACLALDIFVEGVEGVLPGLPRLFRLWISILFWIIVGGLVEKEEGGHGEGRNTIFCYWHAGMFGHFLRLLHRHDELRDVGVPGSVAGEFSNEGDGVGFFEAPDFFGEMGEERES